MKTRCAAASTASAKERARKDVKQAAAALAEAQEKR